MKEFTEMTRGEQLDYLAENHPDENMKTMYANFAVQHGLNHHYNKRIMELESQVEDMEFAIEDLQKQIKDSE